MFARPAEPADPPSRPAESFAHKTRKGAPDRVGRYIEAAAELSDERAPQFAALLRAASSVVPMCLHCIIVVGYGYVQLYRHAYAVWCLLPLDMMQMLLGLTLCFFGGTYVALIAAVEAFRTMGGEKLYGDLTYVAVQMQAVYEANVADDELDLNNDGIADVDQITPQELTQRKLRVSMLAVDAPDKLQSAVGALWAASLAVLATLKFEFAQITALALAIAGMLKFPFVRLVAPALTWALGKDLVHWVDPIIDSGLKLLCIMLVWYLAKIRAAFYSGLRGGQMFAIAFFGFCHKQGWMDRLSDSLATKPFDPDQSYLDEALAFPFAALGIYFQLSLWFSLPFPLDWLLWPATLMERWLEVQISWS